MGLCLLGLCFLCLLSLCGCVFCFPTTTTLQHHVNRTGKEQGRRRTRKEEGRRQKNRKKEGGKRKEKEKQLAWEGGKRKSGHALLPSLLLSHCTPNTFSSVSLSCQRTFIAARPLMRQTADSFLLLFFYSSSLPSMGQLAALNR